MSAVVTAVYNLQRLINLQRFNADYNALQSVNLSGLQNLWNVDISDNDEIGSTGLKSINLSGCTALQELRLDDNDFSTTGFPNLPVAPNLIRLDFDQCGLTGVIDLSGRSSLQNIDFYGNTGITSINILGCTGLTSVNASDCALTQTAVDNILDILDTSGLSNGYVYLDGGTNSYPSVAGMSHKTNLESRGWYVSINPPPTTTSTTTSSTTTTTTSP